MLNHKPGEDLSIIHSTGGGVPGYNLLVDAFYPSGFALQPDKSYQAATHLQGLSDVLL
ncbi:MAG: hypothetical protein WCE54_10020 [Ignavibacteriaceae bacterium]